MILRIHADSRPFSVVPGGAELGIADFGSAMHQIRNVWSDHREIVSLPSWEVVCGPGVDEIKRMMVEDRMANLLFDLGNSAMDAWWGARNAIANSSMMSCEPKHDSLRGIANGKTVICVASGPTTGEHIEEIRTAQWNGAMVVCADSIYSRLVACGIDPDIVCVIERQPIFAEMVPPGICRRTIIVAPPVVDPSTVRGWEGRRVWFWQETPGLYHWLGPNIKTSFSGRSSGTLAVAVAHLLGGSHMYLVGHDLCHIGGRSHDAGVGDLTRDSQAKAEREAPPCSMHAKTHTVCKDGLIKPSTRFWMLCKQDIECMLSHSVVYTIDQRGADVSGVEFVPRIHEFTRSVPSGIDAGSLRVDASRYRAHLKEQIVQDAASWHATSQRPAESLKECMMLMRDMQPHAWAHKDTAGLYTYVLGTIYHAASLRMFLRNGEASWPSMGVNVIRRGVGPMLRIIEADLC